jgi:4-hydroxybenzoate polyprenyltransferase
MVAYIRLMRCHQWIKNLVVFVGPLLGFQLFDPQAAWPATLCFLAFCLASSASYAVNDVLDREADAYHPLKKHRPVASGAVRPMAAVFFALLLLAGAVVICLGLLRLEVAILLGLYFILILAYSVALKERIILDVIVIAVGFVLRAWAGAEAVDVTTSPWLVACTFTLCMFLGFGKRRCEIAMIGDAEHAKEHRATLARYTPDLLNQLTSVSAGIAVVTFLLYTMDTMHPPPFPKEHLLYTLPLVAYGVFRYAMLVETGRYAGPSEIFLKDRALLATIALWGMMALAIVLGLENKLLAWAGGA